MRVLGLFVSYGAGLGRLGGFHQLASFYPESIPPEGLAVCNRAGSLTHASLVPHQRLRQKDHNSPPTSTNKLGWVGPGGKRAGRGAGRKILWVRVGN